VYTTSGWVAKMGIHIPLFRRAGHEESVMAPPEFAHEQASKLVQRLFTATGQTAAASVMFCGVERGSGCSTVCGRTAELLASQVPGSVCVVDANLRAPSLHRYFRLENREGFSDALVGSSSMQGFARQIQGRNLWVITAGTSLDALLPACSERLNSQILTLRTVFDYVLVDVEPVNLSKNAALLGQLVEGVVLVIESNSATRESARQTKEILKAANVRILGAVLNKWTSPVPAKTAVAAEPAQAAKPVANEALRKPKATPKASGRPAPRRAAPEPIARKTPPTTALAKTEKLDVPAKAAKRRGWVRFLRPAAAPNPERGRPIAKEQVRQAPTREVPKGNIRRQQPAAQGAWKKPAPPPTPTLALPPAKEAPHVDTSAPPPQNDAPQEPPISTTSSAAASEPVVTTPTPEAAPEESAPTAATENTPVETIAAAVERQSSPRQTSPWRSKLAAAAIGAIAAGGTLWFMHGRQVISNRPQQASETAAVLVSNPLGLQVDRTGGMLDILWDRTSATAENSNGGVVTIHDGDRVKRVRLDPGEIRTGHIYYRPRSAALDIRLEVAVEDGGTASESVLVVNAPTAGLRSFN
jgi:Mrp family chromosome partitioning ATPase